MLLLLLALQQSPAAAAQDSTPTVTAVRARPAPSIDGRLDDEVWRSATPVATFLQQNPKEGEPATERTEVRVVYDDGALYIGARMYQSDPRQIRAVLTRRDESSPSDAFTVALDTYHDHQTAMIFSINPLGVRSDNLAGNDDCCGDASWDPVWEAATQRDSLGWTAEIRIPLSQLRFPPRAEQVWGVNFFRTITSRNERDAFALVRQNEKGFASRFAHLVGIRGVPTPRRLELLPYARGEVDSRRATPGDPFFSGTATSQTVGLDLKYGVTSNLTLDATVNPDFGQVEADPAQLNLSVFETFFEERRPFFLEGAQIFAFGSSSGLSLAPGSVFYSRRIGRAPTLDPDLSRAYAAGDSVVGPFTDVPKNTAILGAAKLSGKLARGTSIGLLHAETGRAAGEVFAEQLFGSRAGLAGDAPLVVSRRVPIRYEDVLEPRAHYSVGRLRQDFRNGQTSLGVIYTQVLRDLTSPRLDSLFRRDAHAAGIDWNHRWSRNRFDFTGNAVWSAIRGSTTAITAAQRSSARYYQRPDQSHARLDSTRTSLTGTSATAKLRFDSPRGLGFGVGGNVTTPGYELNDIGFLTRADSRTAFASASVAIPKPTSRFSNLGTEVVTTTNWNNGGERTSALVGFNLVAFLQNNWGMFTSVGADAGGITTEATRGGPGVLNTPSHYANLSLFSDSRRALSGSLSASRFLSRAGSESSSGNLSLTWRPALSIELSAGPSYSTERIMGYLVRVVPDTLAAATYGARYVFGALRQTTLALSGRANITFSPTLSFQMYAEPFTSGATVTRFRELLRPRTFEVDWYEHDPNVVVRRDAAGDYRVEISRAGRVVTAFPIENPDARYRSLRGNAVLRWEYRPGATIFAVWQHTRGQYDAGATYGGFSDIRSLLGLPLENVFLVKVNYWLSR